MSKIVFRYIVRTYLGLLLGILASLLAIFLVADFVDRAKAYSGPNWVWDVALLYGYKALVTLHQLGPAALMLAAGATVSLLRKRGELTALGSLSFGPSNVYLPIALCAFLASAGLIAFDEWVVVRAGPRVDEITVKRFNRWGDWRFYFFPKQWFRRNERVFYLRAGDLDQGFQDVTILKFTEDFHLAQRIDAEKMVYLGDTRWKLVDVVDRQFAENGAAPVLNTASGIYDLNARGSDFRVRVGRPELMRFRDLLEQIDVRQRVGLSTGQFRLALNNRFAYPIAAVPAALLAVGLALRLSRRGHLTAALVEGLMIAIGLWGMMVVCRTLVLSERMPSSAAAWAPVGILVIAASTIWLHRERKLKWRN